MQTNSQKIQMLWSRGVEYVINRARLLIRDSQIGKPPFLPERLAKLHGIKVVKADLGNVDGLLTPLREGFEIKTNIKHSPERQNYSCAHEIAHTFFFVHEGKELKDFISSEIGIANMDKWEERLCNIGAAEILMPNIIFKKYASYYDFSIVSVQRLAHLFNTSILATANRLSSINPQLCFTGYSTIENLIEAGYDEKTASVSFPISLNMKISAPGGKYSISRKIKSKNSNVFVAYKSDSPVYSQERMKLPNYIGPCRIESKGFGSYPHRYVVSLIFPENY